MRREVEMSIPLWIICCFLFACTSCMDSGDQRNVALSSFRRNFSVLVTPMKRL